MLTALTAEILLKLLVFGPAAVALVLALLAPCVRQLECRDWVVQKIGLLAVVASLVVSASLSVMFVVDRSGFQFVSRIGFNLPFELSFGLDGLSLTLVLLTNFLILLTLISGENSIKQRRSAFVISVLFLQSFLLAVFCTLDIFLLYVFFEAMLIPMFVIIGIWGGENRTYAAFKFFLYTLAGSVLMLLALIYLYQLAGTSFLPELFASDRIAAIPAHVQRLLWFAFFASFAVKIPLWPFHTWLPDAHVQAPTGGSVLLAGIQLKLGAYGFLRLAMPLLPQATQQLAWVLALLAIISIIYASLVALAQQDMKKLIAYSSVAHMGIVVLGLVANNLYGLQGAMVQMISHGLSSAALFLCVGVVYDRLHSRDIASLGGLIPRMPIFGFFFLLFVMTGIGLPGTSGFVGEFLVLLGAFKAQPVLAVLAGTGTILGAWYSLRLYRGVMLGDAHHPETDQVQDLNGREITMFSLLAVGVLYLGIQPQGVLDLLQVPSNFLVGKAAGLPPPSLVPDFFREMLQWR
jgi:NADH-quinone oxidoreductase subunit M